MAAGAAMLEACFQDYLAIPQLRGGGPLGGLTRYLVTQEKHKGDRL